jgi:SOS response regulatory protein OraA/RecX
MDSLVRRGYDYTTAAEAVRQITEEDFSFSD